MQTIPFNMVINVATGRALDSGGAGGGQAYMHPTPMSGNSYHIWNLQGESNSIIQRAKVWVDRAVSYDQGATANPNGTAASPSTGYRADCSGFVSMAWGLPAQGLQVPNTVSLTQYATTLNSLDQLQPGDAINNRQWGNNGHVVLFYYKG